MLDKGIEHGKEWRKPYYKSKRFDKTCRCHGSCSYCKNNRIHADRKQRMKAIAQEKELELECEEEIDLPPFHD